MAETKIKLIGCKGCGSVIAEAFLVLGGIHYDRMEVNYEVPSPERDELERLNPQCQVPTLVLPDGKILTETLAVAHYVDDRRPEIGLIPKNLDTRTKFYRWAIFLVSSVYPTFTYGDIPQKWVPEKRAAPFLRESTDRRRQLLWKTIENEIEGEFFLGSTMTAIDIYLAAMSHWRPGRKWFAEHCPRITATAERVESLHALKSLWSANF